MGFLNYGTAKGLSIQNDFEKDTDRLYQREAYRAQVMAEKEKKTAYYAEQMKKPPVVSEAITKQLEPYYKDLNNKIAQFAIDNPNFETDVNKLQEFNALTDKYINNDLVRKDQQTQENFKILQKANIDGHLKPKEWDAEMIRYNKFQNEGGDPYTYSGYKALEVTELVERDAKLFGVTKWDEVIGTDRIEYSAATDKDVNAVLMNTWNDPQSRNQIQKKFDSFSEEQKKYYPNGAMEYYRELLKNTKGTEEFNSGMADAAKIGLTAAAARQKQMNSISPLFWEQIASDEKRAFIPGSTAMSALTSAGGEKKTFPQNTKWKTKDENGNMVEFNGGDNIFTLKSVTGYIPKITGEALVETVVTVSVKPDEADEYLAKGFRPSKEVDEGYGMSTTDKTVLWPVMTKTLYTDAVVNPNTLYEYEKLGQGTNNAADLATMGHLDKQNLIVNSYKTGNEGWLRQVINNTYPETDVVISGYHPATGEPEYKTVATPPWKQDPNIPGGFVRIVKKVDITDKSNPFEYEIKQKLDPSTGKLYKVPLTD